MFLCCQSARIGGRILKHKPAHTFTFSFQQPAPPVDFLPAPFGSIRNVFLQCVTGPTPAVTQRHDVSSGQWTAEVPSPDLWWPLCTWPPFRTLVSPVQQWLGERVPQLTGRVVVLSHGTTWGPVLVLVSHVTVDGWT